MSPYKLTYFNSQALGEAIRFLLHYGKIEFEDIRIDFETGWASYPKETLPLRLLPILEVDGRVLHQSISICRYLAKQVGLAGTTALEDYEIDNAVDNVNDFRASEFFWVANFRVCHHLTKYFLFTRTRWSILRTECRSKSRKNESPAKRNDSVFPRQTRRNGTEEQWSFRFEKAYLG